MKVKILAHTPEPEKLVAQSAKLCYSNKSIDNIGDLSEKEIEDFIEYLMSLGHESPLEHVTFTFGVEGVSRALTHQLVRHRIASFSQQSQRYVKLDQFEYITPDVISENPILKEKYIQHMENTQILYDEIVGALAKDGLNAKKAIEDARYVFPNACCSNIIFTMNSRTLLNFLSQRRCNRAQWEIRNLANKMVILLYEIAPTIFKNAGPSCINEKCQEGKMSCGKPIDKILQNK